MKFGALPREEKARTLFISQCTYSRMCVCFQDNTTDNVCSSLGQDLCITNNLLLCTSLRVKLDLKKKQAVYFNLDL